MFLLLITHCLFHNIVFYAGIIISFLTIAAMILASRYVYLTYLVFQKIKTDGVHGCFSTRFNEDDKSRRSVISLL